MLAWRSSHQLLTQKHSVEHGFTLNTCIDSAAPWHLRGNRSSHSLRAWHSAARGKTGQSRQNLHSSYFVWAGGGFHLYLIDAHSPTLTADLSWDNIESDGSGSSCTRDTASSPRGGAMTEAEKLKSRS